MPLLRKVECMKEITTDKGGRDARTSSPTRDME